MAPLEVIEVTVKVGLVRATRHAQIQYSVVDPETGDLMAMRSWPHSTADDWRDLLEDVVDLLEVDVDVLMDPDPF